MRSIFLFFLLLPLACATTKVPPNPKGVQDGYQSFVPAKIVVLKCQNWIPFFDNHEQNSLLPELCPSIDSAIIQGFTNQPYMNGFTPKLVQQMLKKSDLDTHLDDLTAFWKRPVTTSPSSEGLLESYRNFTLPNPKWLVWLHQLSQATGYSDGLLLPLIVWVEESQDTVQGLLTFQRTLKLGLLLLDTNNGNVIWYGERASTLSQISVNGKESTTFVPWPKLLENSLTEELWMNFPGRLTL